MKKNGILIINSSDRYGGTEKWCMLAGKALKQRGFHVVIGFRYPLIGEIACEQGLLTHRLPLWNDADIFSIWKLASIIKRENIRIVIPTKPKEYWLGTVAARLTGIKSYLRLGIVRSLQNKWKNRKMWGSWAHRIIVNSLAIRRALLESGFISPEKIAVIYNGVELPGKLPPFEPHPDEFRFIFMGNLISRKNLDTLLRAYKQFLEITEHIRSKLWIVGDGPERPRLINLSNQLNIQDRVKFWGFRKDVREILTRAQVLVFLSASEGIPNALLEAMAVGVVPVVNNFDGVEEIVENRRTGLVVSAENIHQVASAMAELVTNMAFRKKLREKGFEKVKNQFSIAAMGDKLEKLIKEDLHE